MMHEREMDSWLRRIAILGPIVTFVLGWGSGVITAAMLFKDHEKRINILEGYTRECREDRNKIHEWMARMETVHARER
jgi:hypothetical protein